MLLNELDGVRKSHARVERTLETMSIRLDEQSRAIAECKRIAEDCTRIIEEKHSYPTRNWKINSKQSARKL